jgi:hypothetical protein
MTKTQSKTHFCATIIGLCAICICGVANDARAQAPATNPPATAKDPQNSFEPRTGPGEGQKLMEKMVGEWDVVKSIFPVGKEPRRTKGSCRQMMIHDGRFLRSEFIFEEPDGKKTDGVGILGYDPASGLFTSVWTDSRSTRFSLRQSEGKFDGEQIILYARALEGAPDGRHSRTVAKLEENGKKLYHRQYVVGADGKEFVIMELAMTRRTQTK